MLAPVHDAVLIESAAADIVEAARCAADAFVEASRRALGGFELRVGEPLIIRDASEWPLKGQARRTWDAIEPVLELSSPLEDLPS